MGKLEPSTRQTFAKNVDFLFSAGGAFVGLGNIWRFPYLCYDNGGGAFLIPYFLFLGIIALPLFSLESSVGQISRTGLLKAWKLFPLLRGIGVASSVILVYCNIYYPIIIAWSLRYLVASFYPILQWSHCTNEYNSQDCFSIMDMNKTMDDNSSSSVAQFWEKEVLHKSGGIEQVGSVQWPMYLCLVAIWLLCYFCIWKGVRWTAKIVYFTATSPIVMIIVMIVRGVTLDGALNGISFYLKPEISKLANMKVWMAAASQIIYSYGICFGPIVSLGSYNKINHNFLRDSIVMLLVNSGASFMSGFAVFSVLGFMAKAQGKLLQNTSVEAVAESGPGLVFLVYPQALSLLPLPQIWCVLFFITLILLGLDSQFVFMESFTSAIMDVVPRIRSFQYGREVFIGATSFLFCVIGITMTTEGGIYVFTLLDTFAAAGWSTITLCIFEALAGGWIGGDAYISCMCKILNRRPKILFVLKYIWRFITPLSLLVLVIGTMYFYEPATYNKVYVYPPWAQALGILIACSSVIMIPIFAVYELATSSGPIRSRWAKACRFSELVEDSIDLNLRKEKDLSSPEKCTTSEIKDLI